MFFSNSGVLLSLISKHVMLRMMVMMNDGSLLYNQSPSASNANLFKD